MSKGLTIKLTAEQIECLEEAARYHKTTPASIAATFVEESLRARKFWRIEFRDTAIGRLAYIKGTRLSVWLTVHFLGEAYDNNVQAMADALERQPSEIQAAVDYADAYPEEIEPLIEKQKSMTVEKLKEELPNLIVFDAR